MSDTQAGNEDDEAHSRWHFLRDVLVLQLKLLIGNLHNFVLIPATLAAALVDLLFKSERHGSRFYRVLDWGRQAEEAIGLYSALDRHDREMKHDYTVDALISQIETAVVREYEKGGTAADVKKAVDSVLDGLHWHSNKAADRARQAAQRVIEKLGPSRPADPS
ncbi:MAG TPA: hypothetical protein VGF97_12245 [Rhizomicrobium sp.]|jgi:hypothetical protein